MNLRDHLKNPAVIERIQQLTPEQLKAVVKRFPHDEQNAVMDILGELRTRKVRAVASEDFIT